MKDVLFPQKTKLEDSSIKPKVTLCDQGTQVQEEGLQIATGKLDLSLCYLLALIHIFQFMFFSQSIN